MPGGTQKYGLPYLLNTEGLWTIGNVTKLLAERLEALIDNGTLKGAPGSPGAPGAPGGPNGPAASIGGVSGDRVANTRPHSVVVRSFLGLKSSRQKSLGMPPTPLMPRSKAMPRRLPARS